MRQLHKAANQMYNRKKMSLIVKHSWCGGGELRPQSLCHTSTLQQADVVVVSALGLYHFPPEL